MKKTKISAWIFMAILIGLNAATAMAGNNQNSSRGQFKWNQVSPGARDCGLAVDSLPYEVPDDTESGSLRKMIQEEKLARDVYLAMADLWKLPIFVNIAESEQRHMDAIAALLEKYGIENPVATMAAGAFADDEFNALFAELIQKGNESPEEALYTGATIEELDISDLQEQLGNAIDNEDIRMVYENLLRGSENHIRAFSRILDLYGTVYLGSGYLSVEELEAILLSPHNRTGGLGYSR